MSSVVMDDTFLEVSIVKVFQASGAFDILWIRGKVIPSGISKLCLFLIGRRRVLRDPLLL